MRIAPLVLAAAAVAGTLAPAAAEEPGSRQTREFVAAASQSDRFEILEAETALTQSMDPQVREFAQEMIRDHGRTSATLADAAAHAGLRPPPPGIGADQAALLAALQSVRGPDFDRLYWHQQALAHRSALVTEERYAASGDAPAVRQAAAATVPVIARHLRMAEAMASRPAA